MNIPIPSFVEFLMIQLIKPFTFVSYIGIIIWWIENFFSTSIVLLVSILFFWILNFFLVKQSLIKI
jgi:hypothetical protein